MANTKSLLKVTFFTEKVNPKDLVQSLKKIGIASVRIEEGKIYKVHQEKFQPSGEPAIVGADNRSGDLRVNRKSDIPSPHRIAIKRRWKMVGRPPKNA